MFSGNQPTSVTKYKAMGNDEQLQSVKELGESLALLKPQLFPIRRYSFSN